MAPALPSNGLGFDTLPTAPANAAADTWYDNRPTETEDLPFVWHTVRGVAGTPAVGASPYQDPDAVPILLKDGWTNWLPPRRTGRYGEDGQGREDIFALTATEVAPALPSNGLGFDTLPALPAGFTATAGTWYDNQPAPTEDLPFVWHALRGVAGTPARAVSPYKDPAAQPPELKVGWTNWTAPVVVNRFVKGDGFGEAVDRGAFTIGEDYAVNDLASEAQTIRWTGDDIPGADDEGNFDLTVRNVHRAVQAVLNAQTKPSEDPGKWVFVKTDATDAMQTLGTALFGVQGEEPGADTERLEYVYRRVSWSASATGPGAGGTDTADHVPSGWSSSEPAPTLTQRVIRASRTATFNSDGVFQSATNWSAAAVERSSRDTDDDVYRQAASTPSASSGGTSTYNHTPSGWSRTQPAPTATLGVYRQRRTAVYDSASTQGSSTFVVASAWGSVTLTAGPTGTGDVITTDTVIRYARAAATPAAPSGSTETPGAPWTHTTEPNPTTTLNVYRLVWTRRYTNGAFTSASGVVVKVANATGTSQRTRTFYQRASAAPDAPNDQTFAAYTTPGGGWSTSDPGATQTQAVYEVTLTQHFDHATTQNASTFRNNMWSAVGVHEQAVSLPPANTGVLRIANVPDGVEGTEVSLSAALSVSSVYDEIDYAWSATGGTFDDASSPTPTWRRPLISIASAQYTITLTVTVRGTGTRAAAQTTDTATDNEVVVVYNSIQISGPQTVINSGGAETYSVSVPSGGSAYTYAWRVTGALEIVGSSTGASVQVRDDPDTTFSSGNVWCTVTIDGTSLGSVSKLVNVTDRLLDHNNAPTLVASTANSLTVQCPRLPGASSYRVYASSNLVFSNQDAYVDVSDPGSGSTFTATISGLTSGRNYNVAYDDTTSRFRASSGQVLSVATA